MRLLQQSPSSSGHALWWLFPVKVHLFSPSTVSSWQLCMWEQPAKVRVEVLGCEELSCAKPDVSRRDQPRIKYPFTLLLSKCLQNSLKDQSPQLSPTCQASHIPWFTLFKNTQNSLPSSPQHLEILLFTSQNYSKQAISGHLWTELFLLKICPIYL